MWISAVQHCLCGAGRGRGATHLSVGIDDPELRAADLARHCMKAETSLECRLWLWSHLRSSSPFDSALGVGYENNVFFTSMNHQTMSMLAPGWLDE